MTLGVGFLYLFCMSHIQNSLNWTEIDYNHLETSQPLEFSNISVVSQGPLRASVRAEVKYGQSTISVTVRTSL